MKSVTRELAFLVRDRGVLLSLATAAIAASVAILLGMMEVAQQRATIAELLEADRAERQVVQAGQTDWGGAAYYTFHLTVDEPTDFAFAALGQREVSPWKHRIRMLALEGQIYESDAGNPEFALTGRFDYAFVVSLLAPLLLILLVHDVRSSERTAGRQEWLSATSGNDHSPWRMRSGLKVALLTGCLLVPLWIGGLASSSGVTVLALASLWTALHLLFWWGVCSLIDRRGWTSSVNLVAASGAWLVLAVIAPAAIQAIVDASIHLPDGGDIVLTQREAVNDAWDLPKEATMNPFVARHPEWEDHVEVTRPFEWKWYYAFQQVGDQKAEEISRAFRDGRQRRESLAAKLSWLSPPALLERALQRAAQTDGRSALEYEDRVRRYHAQLRAWYYPKLFPDLPFDQDLLADIPEFSDEGPPDHHWQGGDQLIEEDSTTR
ncbi:MAG: DUF3526 domain-containing protein [Acidobacteriota bacterium]